MPDQANTPQQLTSPAQMAADGLAATEPTQGDLLAIGKAAYQDHLDRQAARARDDQFHTLIHDIRRLYRGWENNEITKGQPFTVTLNEEKVKVLVDGLDRMTMGQAQGLNPVDRVLNQRAFQGRGDMPGRPLGARG